MKSLLSLAALAAIVLPAFAGQASKFTYRCQNECPLAIQANTLRSYGSEAVVASRVARMDLNKTVLHNLENV